MKHAAGPWLLLGALALSAYLLLRRRPAPDGTPLASAVDTPSGANVFKWPPKPSPKSSTPGQKLSSGQALSSGQGGGAWGKNAQPFDRAAWIAQEYKAGAGIRAAATATGHGPLNEHASSGFGSNSFLALEWADFLSGLDSFSSSDFGGGGGNSRIVFYT